MVSAKCFAGTVDGHNANSLRMACDRRDASLRCISRISDGVEATPDRRVMGPSNGKSRVTG